MTQIPMTLQEVFDKAVTAVLNQGECAIYNGTCSYLVKGKGEPLMCAVGHLLPDDETRRYWDMNAISGDSVFLRIVLNPEDSLATTRGRETWEKIGLPVTVECAKLLAALQECHDVASECDEPMKEYAWSAKQTADRFGLSAAVVEQVPA